MCKVHVRAYVQSMVSQGTSGCKNMNGVRTLYFVLCPGNKVSCYIVC